LAQHLRGKWTPISRPTVAITPRNPKPSKIISEERRKGIHSWSSVPASSRSWRSLRNRERWRRGKEWWMEEVEDGQLSLLTTQLLLLLATFPILLDSPVPPKIRSLSLSLSPPPFHCFWCFDFDSTREIFNLVFLLLMIKFRMIPLSVAKRRMLKLIGKLRFLLLLLFSI